MPEPLRCFGDKRRRLTTEPQTEQRKCKLKCAEHRQYAATVDPHAKRAESQRSCTISASNNSAKDEQFFHSVIVAPVLLEPSTVEASTRFPGVMPRGGQCQ